MTGGGSPTALHDSVLSSGMSTTPVTSSGSSTNSGGAVVERENYIQWNIQ